MITRTAPQVGELTPAGLAERLHGICRPGKGNLSDLVLREVRGEVLGDDLPDHLIGCLHDRCRGRETDPVFERIPGMLSQGRPALHGLIFAATTKVAPAVKRRRRS